MFFDISLNFGHVNLLPDLNLINLTTVNFTPAMQYAIYSLFLSTGLCGSPKKTGSSPMFFPTTTITANGVAKITTLDNEGGAYDHSNGAEGLSIEDRQHRSSPVIIKMEPNGPPSCCVGEE